MQLAKQLKAVGLGAFPCAVSYDEQKQRWNKRPLTVAHESWQVTAQRPLNDPQIQWDGVEVVGVPIPRGVIVLDMDVYKTGAWLPERVDQVFGIKAPWRKALIQTTIGGGAHFAFKLPANWPEDAPQGSNVFGAGSFVDTRIGGKGFICTGRGYHPAGMFGVLRMGRPETLPELPAVFRYVLCPLKPDTRPEPPQTPAGGQDNDIEVIKDALRYIDPTERQIWFATGCAIHSIFKDDEETGFQLFDEWSRGEYWPDGCPDGYDASTQHFQWTTMRPDRPGNAIHGGTLFHMALKGGWNPPARFDTSAAFGSNAIPVEAFNGLIDRIISEGSDSRKTEELLRAITTSGCNDIQALLLRNELKAALRSVKLLDKNLSATIDKKTAPLSTEVKSGLYAGNDTDNATMFLSDHYPNGSLIKCDGEFYRYTGKCWEKISTDLIKHQIAMSMAPSRLQAARINSCIDTIFKLCPTREGGMNGLPSHKIIFDNGVLDLITGQLEPHNPAYFTTNMLPYNYSPQQPCSEWIQFLYSSLDGDLERTALIQEWFGYQMVREYRHHKVMLLLGPKRSGKGTIGKVLQALVGEKNFSGGSLTSFAVDSFIDSLRTKTVVFVGDAEKKLAPAKVNQVIERIKTISGNDSIAFDRKFLSGMSESLPTRITIAANSVPNLFDDSGALASRLLVVPFNRSFYGQEDLYLVDRLLMELPGIAAWALEGLQRLQQRGGFTMPAASRDEIEYIIESYSPLARFVNEGCEIGQGFEATSEQLYSAYKEWCLAEGEDILRRKTFISAVRDATRGERVRYASHRFSNGVKTRGFKGIRPALIKPSAFGPA